MSESRAAFAVCAVCLLLGGVCRAAHLPGEARGSPPSPRGPTRELIEQAGDLPLATLVLRPEHWRAFCAEAVARLVPFLDKRLGLSKQQLEAVFAAPGVMAALARVLGCATGKDVSGFGDWPGWDATRPIVAALAEVGDDYVTPYTFALRASEYYDRPTGYRHRLLIPATDSRRLAARIRELLEQVGWRRMDLETPAQAEGASFHGAEELDGFACVIPEQGRVRVELSSGEAFIYVFAARTKNDDPEIAAAAYAKMRQGIFREMAGRPAGAGRGSPSTPAMHLVVSSKGDLLSILVRTWRARSLGAHTALNVALRAVSYADASEQEMLLAKALEETIVSDRLMSPAVAEVDDIGLSWSHAPGFRVTQVTDLTELGERVLHAGYRLEKTGMLSDLRSRAFDARAAWEAAPANSALSEAGSVDAANGMLEMCGAACSAYMELRGKMGVMRSLYLLNDEQGRQKMDALLSMPGVLYDIGQTAPRMLGAPEHTRKAIAGRALVGEYEPGSARVEMRVDLVGMSRMRWQYAEQAMLRDGSFACYDRVRKLTVSALRAAILSEYRPGRRAASMKSLKKTMGEMRKALACTQSNPALHARASAMLGFLESTRLGRAAR
ncbi:MAG: hypothetical protein JXR96_19905 [Deltaproteobacteria bacterium]|nr:hypothetical protein [Deltaproteobacteria bacterium]